MKYIPATDFCTPDHEFSKTSGKLKLKFVMRWLLFLSKLAFICNVLFLIAFCFRLGNWVQWHDLISIIIIIGWVLVFLFNPLVNLCYLILFITKRKALAIVPVWLKTSNIFFLIIELIFVAFLNISKF